MLIIKMIILEIKKKISTLDIHTLEVFKKSSAATIIKVLGKIFGVFVSILLGRTIGASGLGIINLSDRIINLLLIVGLFGMKQVIVKEVAIAHNKEDYTRINDVMKTVFVFNGCITFILSIFFIFLTPWLAENIFHEPQMQLPLAIFLIVLTPQVFSRIFSSALIGYRKIWQSSLAEQTLSSFITAILLLFFLLLDKTISINLVALIYAVSRILVTFTLGFYWRSLSRSGLKLQNLSKILLATAVPLFFHTLAIILIGNMDVILLGIMRSTEEVGYYVVASRLALLTSFFLQITNSSVAPQIASLYESDKKEELKLMLNRVTKLLGYFGLIQLLIFVIIGYQLLSIWGEDFTKGYWILVTLGIGQLVNIGTGAVGLVLVMCGFENLQKNISMFFLIINLLMNLIFIYFWGAIGAAIASALTYAGINLVRYYFVFKKTGIKTIF